MLYTEYEHMKDVKSLDKIKTFFSTRKYVLLLLFWVIHVVWYFVLNKYQTNSHLIHIPLDDKIPFIAAFSIPYVLWFVYIAFGHIWTLFHTKRDFLVMCCMVFLCDLIGMIICTAYPSMHDMRPDDAAMGNSFFADIVRWLYSTENPYCILPSQHTMLVIVITVGLIFSDGLKGNLAVKIILPIYAVSVMLATVFIKQHSIVDVFAGIGVTIPVILLTYFVILPRRRFAPKPELDQGEAIAPLAEEGAAESLPSEEASVTADSVSEQSEE